LPFLALAPGASPGDPPAPPSADEAAVLELVNTRRKAAGLPAVRANPKLMEAARGHAANMAKQDKLVQELDGRDGGGRATAAGYRWRSVYGLLARGPDTPKAVVAEWLDERTPRRHIEDRGLLDAGVGVAANAQGKRYWYLVLAAPADD
jgi:uncharacterized protein YkwD